jgi:hypothetical protein
MQLCENIISDEKAVSGMGDIVNLLCAVEQLFRLIVIKLMLVYNLVYNCISVCIHVFGTIGRIQQIRNE